MVVRASTWQVRPLFELVRHRIIYGTAHAFTIVVRLFVGAIRVAKKLGPGHTVVTMLCDVAGRYSDKLYNPSFLSSLQLQSPPWLDGGFLRDQQNVLNDEQAFGQLLQAALDHGETN